MILPCATVLVPIRYTLVKGQQPHVEGVNFAPAFLEHLYFVYLNQKQDSQNEVAAFDYDKLVPKFIHQINKLTDEFLEQLLWMYFNSQWENMNIKSACYWEANRLRKIFLDYNGAVKSLGAWR